MYGIVPHQAQQAARAPRDAANQPRPADIIDLVSDEEASGSEDLYDEDEEDVFFDPPEDALQAHVPAAVPGQQQAAAGAEPRLGLRHLLMNNPQAYEFWPGAEPPVQQQAGAGAGAQLYRPNDMPVGPAPAMARGPTPPPALNQAWGDYILDDDFDAEQFAQAIEAEWRFDANPPAPRVAIAPGPLAAPAAAAPAPPAQQPPANAESRDECIQMVAAVFPGICFDHVSELYDKIAKSSERLIAHLLDQMDKGILYPKAKDKAKDLKRKRELDENEEAARKYGAPDRIIPAVVNGIRPYM